MAGRFITLEGGEGVGKTTNMACIQALLEEKNIPLLLLPRFCARCIPS
jgi:dTMP kinase